MQEAHAAGVLYECDDGRVLLLRRSAEAGDYPGFWCWPAGGIDFGETAREAAARESGEEIGYTPEQSALRKVSEISGFITYRCYVERPFEVKLNAEHDAFTWALPESLPSQVHPGCLDTLTILQQPRKARTADRRIHIHIHR